MMALYHIVITDDKGNTILDEARETFVYGSPDPVDKARPDSKGQWTWTSRMNFIKLIGPLVVSFVKDKVGGD